MKLPLEVSSSEITPLIIRLRSEGKRIVNLEVTSHGYRILGLTEPKPQQAALPLLPIPADLLNNHNLPPAAQRGIEELLTHTLSREGQR